MNMKLTTRKALCAALFTLITMTAGAQLFSHVYGGHIHDRTSRDVCRTSNGEYLIVGMTTNPPVDADLYVMLTDANGTKLWDTAYGGDKPDYAYHMAETADGNYIVAGYSQSNGAGDYDIYLLKLNAKGKYIGHRMVNFSGKNEEARQILRTPDNNFLVVGTTGMGSTSVKSDIVLLHIKDDLSDVQSPKFIDGHSDMDYGLCIALASDGGYLVAGQSRNGSNGGDAFVMKLSSDLGTEAWRKTYHKALDQEVVGLVANSDGTAMLAIRDSVGGGTPDGNIDIMLMKIDQNGDVIGSPVMYGDFDKDTPKAIAAVPSGGYIVGAISRSSFNGTPQVWLLRTDADGKVQPNGWDIFYGDLYEHDHVHQVKTSHDNGFLVVGHQRQAGIMRITFMKLNESGYLDIKESGEVAMIDGVFPNPSAGEFVMRFRNEGIHEVTIFNTVGQQVFNGRYDVAHGKEHRVSLPAVESGVYLMRIDNRKGSSSVRLIVN